jgi:hypothetical protein
MPFVRCPEPADAAAAVDALRTAAGDGLFLFFGSEDPGTGASWCKDCVVADPVLRRTIALHAKTLTTWECPVGARADWKGVAGHPYRVHPAFRIERIPTLVRFRAGCEIGRLVEADCADPARVAAFLA